MSIKFLLPSWHISLDAAQWKCPHTFKCKRALFLLLEMLLLPIKSLQIATNFVEKKTFYYYPVLDATFTHLNLSFLPTAIKTKVLKAELVSLPDG
jgi:hypothetical protein